MSRNQVFIKHDVSVAPYKEHPQLRLHLQWGCYMYVSGDPDYGYRFMWSEAGRLKPLRGGARIPSMKIMQRLIKLAKDAGWGDLDESDF
jgi:hypothetical protein